MIALALLILIWVFGMLLVGLALAWSCAREAESWGVVIGLAVFGAGALLARPAIHLLEAAGPK